TAAAFEVFLSEEDVDVPLKFLAVGIDETTVEGDVLADDLVPLGWEGDVLEPLPSSSLEEVEHVLPLASWINRPGDGRCGRQAINPTGLLPSGSSARPH